MPTYTISKIEHHKVNLVHSLTFDTAGQNAWDRFREVAREYLGDEVDDFPENAPDYVDVWFELLSWVNGSDYDKETSDWWTLSNGSFAVTITLEDKQGKKIKSEEG